jgi:O-antigen/teichoic acid export membrane protein
MILNEKIKNSLILNRSAIRILIKIAGLISNAGIFALLARKLAAQDMAMWALASTSISVVMSLDFGVSNFVRNELVKSASSGLSVFANGLKTMFILATIYSTIFLCVLLISPSHLSFLGQLRTAVPYLVPVAVLLCIRLPGCLASTSFYSFGESELFYIFEAGSLILSALSTIVIIWMRGTIMQMLLSFYISGTIVSIISLIIFCKRRKWQLNMILRSKFDPRIFLSGFQFGILQICALSLSSLPPLLIGMININEVTMVRAIMMISQTVLGLHLAHAMPIWTEISSLSFSKSSKESIIKIQKRLWNESLIVGSILCLSTVLTPLLIRIWIGKEGLSFRTVIAFAVWAVGAGVGNIYSLVLNGNGKPMLTVAAILPGALIAISSSFIMNKNFGGDGVPISFALGSVTTAVLMFNFGSHELRGLKKASMCNSLPQ